MMAEDSDAKPTEATSTEEVRRLKAQVLQLKNVIKKMTGQSDGEPGSVDTCSKRKKKKEPRPFDFRLYKKRHVLFRIAYFGWDYHGFAVQEIAGKTIESELFRALVHTRLIESRETSNFHRCGRTDKGVSAFRQVISIDVRSNLLDGVGVFAGEECAADDRAFSKGEELDYARCLNANLPEHIQVVAWAPCADRSFSARFDCKVRKYKYFFPFADLDLSAMNVAGERLLGERDFRNFCKMDVNNGVVNYMRRIDRVHAEVLSPTSSSSDPYAMCTLTVEGKAFLWHQIRCIVAVLFRVGEGKEDPGVIDELLDIEKNPCRPQYVMASEAPLNLFDCQYDDVEWQYNEESLSYVLKQFQALWTEHQVKASMLRAALESLEEDQNGNGFPKVINQSSCLLPKSKSKIYVPLMEMDKCRSLDDKVSLHQAKKRRLEGSGDE
jgi:tRNA pseudouridine38/39 synthase